MRFHSTLKVMTLETSTFEILLLHLHLLVPDHLDLNLLYPSHHDLWSFGLKMLSYLNLVLWSWTSRFFNKATWIYTKVYIKYKIILWIIEKYLDLYQSKNKISKFEFRAKNSVFHWYIINWATLLGFMPKYA